MWNLVEINGKQTVMGNLCVPTNDSKMLYKLDYELETQKYSIPAT